MKLFAFILGVLMAADLAVAVTPIPEKAVSSSFRTTVIRKINELTAASAGGVLEDGKFLLGNGDDEATAVTMSGAASMTNAGVVSLTDTLTDGNYALKVAKASYSFADGDLAVGAHSLGVNLPAKAVIVRSYIRVTLQMVDTGTCTVAISCEDANNIKTATDITGSAAGAFIEGESTGAASAFKASIAAECPITLTVADGGSCVPSAGTGSVFVEYVVHN